MRKSIRVLVVDDSVVCSEMLAQLIGQAPDLQVIGTANSGKDAIVLNRQLRPDLITMDVQMPGLDGFSTIEEIMASLPVPILMVTSSPVHQGVDRTFQALEAGALDLMEKPDLDGDLVRVLHDKIRLLAGVRVVHRRRTPVTRAATATLPAGKRRPVVGIACSTGGPKLLHEILAALPRSYLGCILITQHIPAGFNQGFADWLNGLCPLQVTVAAEQDPIRAGRVYIAPSGSHLVLRSSMSLGLGQDPAVDGHRPSGTVMFESLARHCPEKTLGVVLSGMGRDGAAGLLSLRRAGGLCVAQDEHSSIVYGMPRTAVELGAAERILDVPGIIGMLLESGSPRVAPTVPCRIPSAARSLGKTRPSIKSNPS